MEGCVRTVCKYDRQRETGRQSKINVLQVECEGDNAQRNPEFQLQERLFCLLIILSSLFYKRDALLVYEILEEEER